MTWDDTVEMMGSFPVYWAVLRNDEDVVEVWASPFEQVPQPVDANETRSGLTAFLAKPLTSYNDRDLSLAAATMAQLAWEDFLMASLVNRTYKALKEQREREGGYVPATGDEIEPEEG